MARQLESEFSNPNLSDYTTTTSTQTPPRSGPTRLFRAAAVTDDREVWQLLKQACREAGGWVADSCSSSPVALETIQGTKPDVVMVDDRALGTCGLQGLPALRQAVPGGAVVVVSASKERNAILSALMADCGYLIMPSQPQALARILWIGTSNATPLCPESAKIVLGHSTPSLGNVPTHPLLTATHNEVMAWLSVCPHRKMVANIMELSPRTVDAHLETIYSKLNVQDLASALCVWSAG
jgi:two-component system, NarL family, nitrate/nitrite response regulator NarL